MKKKKALVIITCIIAAAAILSLAGYGIYCGVTNIDFGNIVIDSIPEKAEDTTRVMSFNVRCKSDPEGNINNRSKLVNAILDQYAPDSFGLQEAVPKWLRLIERELGGRYERVGVPRDFYGPFSEYSCVYYLKDKFDLIDSGTIWLSETPEKKWTKSFDSQCYRIATWATLKNKETGAVYTHLNTHLDHGKESTRFEQAKVLVDKIKELEKISTVVCTGDFNTDLNESAYDVLIAAVDDTMLTAKNTDSGTTYHAYGKKEPDKLPIDFIFTTKGVETATYKVVDNTVMDMYPSDHYALCSDIYIK